jgi:hypothetical protein
MDDRLRNHAAPQVSIPEVLDHEAKADFKFDWGSADGPSADIFPHFGWF